MEEIINFGLDKGLGVLSFLFLMFFIFKYQEKQNELMKKISDTMIQMQITMETMKQSIIEMTDRIEKIEEKIKVKKVEE